MGLICTKLTFAYNHFIPQPLRYGIWFFAIRFQYFSFLSKFYFNRLKCTLTYNEANHFPKLHEAAHQGLTNIVEHLIQDQTNLEIHSIQKYTPLHCAVSSNKIDTAKLLLAKGSNIEAKSDHDFTPLHLAVSLNYLEMTKVPQI